MNEELFSVDAEALFDQHLPMSEDPCPEWQCPDLSSEDRREGRTCPSHPCTCSDRQYGTVPAERISEAEAKELMTIHAIAQATGMSVESAFDALTDIRKAARDAEREMKQLGDL